MVPARFMVVAVGLLHCPVQSFTLGKLDRLFRYVKEANDAGIEYQRHFGPFHQSGGDKFKREPDEDEGTSHDVIKFVQNVAGEWVPNLAIREKIPALQAEDTSEQDAANLKHALEKSMQKSLNAEVGSDLRHFINEDLEHIMRKSLHMEDSGQNPEKRIAIAENVLRAEFLENPGTILSHPTFTYRGEDLLPPSPPTKRKKSPQPSPHLKLSSSTPALSFPSATSTPSAFKLVPPSSMSPVSVTKSTFKNSRLRLSGVESQGPQVLADRQRSAASHQPEVISTTSRNDGPQWEWTFEDHAGSHSGENVDYNTGERKPAKGTRERARAPRRPAAPAPKTAEALELRKEEELKTTVAPEAWLDRFYGRMNRTLSAIKDDFSKIRITTPESPLALLSNIVAPRNTKAKGGRGQRLPRPNNVLEAGPKDHDYVAEQIFSAEQFAVDPLPPATDMNTMNLFHMAAAENPNNMRPGGRQPDVAVATAHAATKAHGNDDFFDNFPRQSSHGGRLAPTSGHSPDAFNDFIDNFSFEREFDFSRVGEGRRNEPEEEDGKEQREEKTTFVEEFSLPREFHKFGVDVGPPDWLKDSGW